MTALTFLDAATATGESSIKALPFLVSAHSVQATITGAPTAVTVDLEGSLDGETFFVLATHPFTAGELTAAAALFHVIERPVNFVRVNLLTLTAGTAPTVTVKYDGDSIPGKTRTGRRGQF